MKPHQNEIIHTVNILKRSKLIQVSNLDQFGQKGSGMDTQLITTQMRHRSWMEDYAKQQESGLTVKAWCQEKGITQKTFYYRLRVLREEACSLLSTEQDKPAADAPEFVRVGMPKTVEDSSGIKIKLDSVEISISPDASNEHVRMVLEAIAHA